MTRKNSNSRIPNGETTRTLPEPDADEVMAQYRAYLRILLLKALKALEDGLDSDDPRVKLASATKILQGVGFFQGGGMDTILRTTAALGQKREERLLRCQNLILRGLRKKAEKYQFPLPEGLCGNGGASSSSTEARNSPGSTTPSRTA
jgi:hypothetical protein